jgi:hypothetical protein
MGHEEKRNKMTTEASLRFRIIAGILIFCGFLMVTAKIIDPDFYWHLRDGEAILTTHAVPRVDTYSYTMPGIPWVDHEWLVEALFAWMWNHGLIWLLDIIFAIIAFIPFVIWLRRYRTWPAIWTITAGAALFISFLAVRPQMLSYLFFFFIFELLSRRKRIYLIFLPIIFFVWANIHAEFFSGLALFGIFILTDAIATWWRKKKIAWNNISFSCAVLVASIVTPLLNPYGAGLYGEIFRVMFSGNTMRYIQEWQSPLLVRAAFSPQTIASAFLFSVFILVVANYYKRLPPATLATGIIFFLLFLKTMRMGPLFVIVAIPLICEGSTYALTEISSRWHVASRRVKMTVRGIGIAASIAAFCLIIITPITLAETQYPTGAVSFLNQSATQGKHIVILNNYNWGGYLIWNAPEIKVFVDGRMPHWVAPDGTSAMTDYADIFLSPTSTIKKLVIIKKWGINTILIENPNLPLNNQDQIESGTAFIQTLRSAGWVIAYHDPTAIILTDQNP